MGFIDSIKNCFRAEELPVEPIYRAVLFGDSAAYFENVRSVVGFSEEEIILSLKRGGLRISGEKLYIKKYCSGDVAVCGKIRVIERI